ncbi:hypothetical protein PTTG_04112 [Puccinia triticina 1-1 BBBD Race 1]|uniref:Uncharacterized protein n=1 Tax=Puccinia triticina (isolate 1-1 / race 1 (BBBD)) TaxID=630390 RepID=A0A180GPT6_PUCT1|nr:hypothetical protein PTTG_04112 [Puccinia triticina 1-1 BBBD Race 1]
MVCTRSSASRKQTRALLTDLPAELLKNIIDHFISSEQHYDWYDERLQDIRFKAKYNLQFKKDYTSIFSVHKTHATRKELKLSWPEGLPSNPLLPLCLVNRTFGKYAQQALFTHVTLVDQGQACLFYQALTSPSLSQDSSELRLDEHRRRSEENQAARNAPASPIDDQYPPASLAHLVRSLEFKFIGPCSMGRGGGSLMCEILRACPFVENITIATSFLTRCQEPILDALASRPLIKSFVLIENPNKCNLVFTWPADQVMARVFTQWDLLETVELIRFHNLSLSFEPADSLLPALNCGMNGRDLRMILNGSRASLRKLQLCNPDVWLHRPGLYRILTECISPALESLTLEVDDQWGKAVYHEEDARPELDPGLLDHIFKTSSTLSNLKKLSFAGNLVGKEFFNFLPQSIVQLTWDRCEISFEAFAQALTSHIVPSQLDAPSDAETRLARWLPELKCCSIYNLPYPRGSAEDMIKAELRARHVYEIHDRPYYGSDSDRVYSPYQR